MRQDDVRRERGQFCCVPANFAGIGRGPANVDAHVAADGPSQQRQLLQERPDPGLPFRIVRSCGQEHADPTDALTLLCACRKRPRRRRAAQKGYERAPLHSITSSARCCKNKGTSRPIALAVLRLITSSNLTGIWKLARFLALEDAIDI